MANFSYTQSNEEVMGAFTAPTSKDKYGMPTNPYQSWKNYRRKNRYTNKYVWPNRSKSYTDFKGTKYYTDWVQSYNTAKSKVSSSTSSTSAKEAYKKKYEAWRKMHKARQAKNVDTQVPKAPQENSGSNAENVVGAFGLVWNNAKAEKAVASDKVSSQEIAMALQGLPDKATAESVHKKVHGGGMGIFILLGVAGIGTYFAMKG